MKLPSLRPAAAIVFAIGLVGCSDEQPTAADNNSQPIELSAAAAADFEAAISDVRERVLPALAAVDAPAQVLVMLDNLSASIVARDPQALRRVLGRAEHVLGGLAQDNQLRVTIESELDAIRLILDQARPLLHSTKRPESERIP